MTRFFVALIGLSAGVLMAQTQQGLEPYSLPRVDATGGQNQSQNQTRSGGISHVTRQTPQANSMIVARGFFSAAGVDLNSTRTAAPSFGSPMLVTAGKSTANPASQATAKQAAPVSMSQLMALAEAARQGNAVAKARLASMADRLAGGDPRNETNRGASMNQIPMIGAPRRRISLE